MGFCEIGVPAVGIACFLAVGDAGGSEFVGEIFGEIASVLERWLFVEKALEKGGFLGRREMQIEVAVAGIFFGIDTRENGDVHKQQERDQTKYKDDRFHSAHRGLPLLWCGLLFVECVAEEGEFLEGEGFAASLGVDVEDVEKGIDGFNGDFRKART